MLHASAHALLPEHVRGGAAPSRPVGVRFSESFLLNGKQINLFCLSLSVTHLSALAALQKIESSVFRHMSRRWPYEVMTAATGMEMNEPERDDRDHPDTIPTGTPPPGKTRNV